MVSSLDQIKFTHEAALLEEEHLYKQPILDVILAALLGPSFLGREPSTPRLKNEDTATLAGGYLPDSLVVRAIELYGSDLDTSSTALLNLRENGVGNTLIEAMLSK
jgi:hypothetical protein